MRTNIAKPTRIFRTIFLILLVQFSLTAQTLNAEYTNVSPIEDAAKLDQLISELKADPDSKALVLISVGNDSVKVGNVFGYKSRVESYLRSRLNDWDLNSPLTKVELVSGGERFHRKLWLIKKGDPVPEYKPFVFDISAIGQPLLYASNECRDCETGELDIWQFDWDNLIEILKRERKIAADFQIGNNAVYYAWDEERQTGKMTPERYLKVLKDWFESEISADQTIFRLVDGQNERIYLIPRSK